MPKRAQLTRLEHAGVVDRTAEDERHEALSLRFAAQVFVERFGRSAKFDLPGETFTVKIAGSLEEAKLPISPLVQQEVVSYMDVLAYRTDAAGEPTAVFMVRLHDVGDVPILAEDKGELFKNYAPMNLSNKMITLGCILFELDADSRPEKVSGLG